MPVVVLVLPGIYFVPRLLNSVSFWHHDSDFDHVLLHPDARDLYHVLFLDVNCSSSATCIAPGQ